MSTVKLTAKRQATLPVDVCRELGVAPGDRIHLEKRIVKGESVWVLRPEKPDTSSFGSLRKYAGGKPHDIDSIRASIARGRRAEAP